MFDFQSVLDLDKEALLVLNGSPYPFWDQFIYIYTGKLIWLPLILVLCFVVIKNQKLKAALLIFVMVGIVIVLADQISSTFFKPYFERYRPTREPEIRQMVKLVNGYRAGKYGFISSHAANSFGLVTFLSLLFKNRLFTFVILIWAIVTCYSRIYLGVHYPGDILGGALLGSCIGWGMYQLYNYLNNKYFFKRQLFYSSNYTKSGYDVRDMYLIIATLGLTILLIVILSSIRVW